MSAVDGRIRVGSPRLEYTLDTELWLSTTLDEVPVLNDCATLVIRTGSCQVQTYLTPSACDQLADLLTCSAAELRSHQPAVAAAPRVDRLISAAPALLAELIYLRECIENGGDPVMGRVNRAIAAAQGERE